MSPAMLAALTAVSVPLIIHLIYQRKSRRVDFSSLMFLKLIDMRIARRQRLKELLLMALRMAVLLFLVLALTRPVLTARGTPGSKNASTSAVFIIDDSYSMGAARNGSAAFARAVEAFEKALSTFSDGDQVALVTLSTAVRAKPVFVSSTKRMREMLDALGVTFLPGDMPGAIEKAYAMLASTTSPNREIYIATDMQTLAWKGVSEKNRPEKFDPGVTVFILDAGGEPPANLALAGVETLPGEKPASRAIDARIRNFSASDGLATCTLTWDGERLKEASATIPALSEGIIRMVVEDVKPGAHQGAVQLADDALPQDNIRYFTTDRPLNKRILLVNGAPSKIEYQDEIFYLRNALDPGFSPEASVFTPEVASSRTFDASGLDKYAAVVLANVPRISRRAARRLKDFVFAGGGLLIFPGDRVNPGVYNSNLSELLPAKLGRSYGSIEEGKMEKTFTFRPDLGHDAFVPLASAGGEFFAEPRFWRAFTLEISKQGGSMGRFSNTEDALMERAVGRGRVILAAFPADLDWTNMAVKAHVFLPLIQQLVRYATGTEDTSAEFTTGGTVSVSAAGNTSVTLPGGSDAALGPAEDGKAVLECAREPGVYRFVSHDGMETRERLVAVNFDPAESDPERVKAEDLEPALKAENLVVTGDLDGIDDIIFEYRHGRELFLFFLVLALLAFIGECFLSNYLVGPAEEEADALDDFSRYASAKGTRSGGALHVRTSEEVEQEAVR